MVQILQCGHKNKNKAVLHILIAMISIIYCQMKKLRSIIILGLHLCIKELYTSVYSAYICICIEHFSSHMKDVAVNHDYLWRLQMRDLKDLSTFTHHVLLSVLFQCFCFLPLACIAWK